MPLSSGDGPAAAPGAPAPAAPRGAVGALVVLWAVFAAAAIVRQLNFDECLALKSGFLLFESTPASPPFAMPITALLGGLGRLLSSPAAVFLLARLAVVTSLAIVAAWAARVAALPALSAALAGCATLLNAAFAVHGLEFRYDWAILLGLLAAYALLVRGLERDFALLGLVVAWLSVHHVKGLFFAAAVYAFTVWRSRLDRDRLVRLHVGLAAGLAAWAVAAAALGFWSSAAAQHRFWIGAASAAPARDYRQLMETFRRDGAFWLAALASLAWLLFPLVSRAAPLRESRTFWAAALGGLALAFPLVHPQPWPYMLALPAPFFAILLAEAAVDLARRGTRYVVTAALLCAAVQALVSGSGVIGAYARSFRSRRSPQERVLAMLTALRRPGERVLDPSGLAYFAPACSTEWYVDGLLEPNVAAGRWMRELEDVDPSECRWVIKSHRLGMLPATAAARVSERYVVTPGGLGLVRGDERLPELTRLAREGPHDAAGRFLVKSFW